MKNLITIFLIIFSLTAFGQEKYSQEKELLGVIVDSLTNEPIPFSIISINQKTNVKADIEGKFSNNITIDSIYVLKVSAVGYEKLFLTTSFDSSSITIKLKQIPLNTRLDSIIWGKISDTTYYLNGKIKSIIHSRRNEIGYYKSGQKKYHSLYDEYREWYENGNIKYLSIIKFNHHRIETRWFENGVIKEQGTSSWGFKKKRKVGAWYKNNDWKYWDRHGREINYR